MPHPLYRVTGLEIVGDYTIRAEFDDGSSQTIDLEPVLHEEMWGPLRDPAVFNQAAIDPVAHTVALPNGADFDPETLHNWPDYRDELAARAAGWQLRTPGPRASTGVKT